MELEKLKNRIRMGEFGAITLDTSRYRTVKGMETRTITVRVDAETADAYESSSEMDRRRIDLLLNLRLREVVKKTRPLEEVMEEISRKAQARGLTPEILKSLLNES